MRVLVCGGRDYGDLLSLERGRKDPRWPDRERQYRHVMSTLDTLAVEKSIHFNPDDNWLPSDFVIISGGATGADSAAVDWAVCNWCGLEEYPADWAKHGRSAGPIRNAEMLESGKPDLVIAFPGGRGTRNMVEQAERAGVIVKKVGW